MTIHLIKSAELSAEVFTAVYDLLTAVYGTIVLKCNQNFILNLHISDVHVDYTNKFKHKVLLKKTLNSNSISYPELLLTDLSVNGNDLIKNYELTSLVTCRLDKADRNRFFVNVLRNYASEKSSLVKQAFEEVIGCTFIKQYSIQLFNKQ